MLFSLLKHYLNLYITDSALKVSRSFYFLTTSIFHGIENYFPRLWGTGISDAIFTRIYLLLDIDTTSDSLLYPPKVSGGYFGLAFATLLPPRVERFSALTL